MVSFSRKLLAAGGLVLATLLLVSASADLHGPLGLKRSAVGALHGHDLVARRQSHGGGGFSGGGFGNPFAGAVGAAPKIADGQLNPGNTAGQGQGTTSQQGIGQKNLNASSGLPAEIVATGEPQTQLFLDPSQIAKGLANDGQAVPAAGQVASATSVNNFINSCLLRTDLPLTNGQQVTGGSCNAVPMGVIAAQNKAPSCKFTNPKNLDVVPPNQDFTITLAVNNLETGNFVNAQQNYFSAPQATNAQGIIIGHSHVVVEQIDSLKSTTPTDPTKFAFFKGLNDKAVNGVLSVTVTGGLPEGVYKMSSIQSAANHQPVLVGVAQHGSLDDAVYFVASNDPNAVATALGGNANANANATNANAGGNASAASSSSTVAASTAAAAQGTAAASSSATAQTTAAASSSAAAQATASATGQQQQQQPGGARSGGRSGGRGNKRREFPHAQQQSSESRLAKRLAEMGLEEE